MGLNKKQKKQMDVSRHKIQQLQQQLSGAKKQVDDPEEVDRLEKELAKHEATVERIKSEGK